MQQNDNLPGNVFLYDSLDKENPKQHNRAPISNRNKNPLYILLGGIFSSGFLLLFHYWCFQMIESYEPTYQTIGWIMLIVLYTCVAALMIMGVIMFSIWGMNKASRVGLVNLMEHQTTIDRMSRVEAQYFDIMGRRMDQSLFTGVQNLTYSPHNTQQIVPPIMPIEDEETINDVLEEDLPVLKSLQEQGLIGRSGNSILLGFGND